MVPPTRVLCGQAGDEVAAVAEGKNTFDNTIGPLAEVEQSTAALISCVNFMNHVHPDKVRAAPARGARRAHLLPRAGHPRRVH
jgi:hypothetical protein